MKKVATDIKTAIIKSHKIRLELALLLHEMAEIGKANINHAERLRFLRDLLEEQRVIHEAISAHIESTKDD